MEEEDELRRVVEAQAQARIAGDAVAFASYVTPQALLRLHRQGEGIGGRRRGRRYVILDITLHKASASSDVEYYGSGSYVLRTRWERRDGVWRAVMIEMPPDLTRGPWWRRWLRLERSARPPGSERRDLR